CKPPLKVKDLFIDIQDGKILMALLEVLSGQKLMHEYKSSTHRIFRLNNIAKALKFLEDSNVKLVSIDAAEIADGNSSLVLGLIWNIILFFQIKELTGNLNRNSSSSSLSSGPSGPESDTSPSTPSVERNMSITVKDQRKAIRALLIWVQRKTRKYGVAVQDFTSSWRSGLAFLAVIKAIDCTLVDMKHALEKSARENLEDAFSIAQNKLGVPRLLEPEDIMVESPDEQSIVTYVAQFLEHFPELEGEDFTDPDKELPIESTYVHIKDTPSEKEGKILILSESEESMYTVNHERSHPAPPKVHIHDIPETISSETTSENCNGKLSQVLDDIQGMSEEEPQRPTSLKITGPVSFESNSSWEVLNDKFMQDVPKTPEDLDSCDEVESAAEVLPSSSKVSVIPHDLFYYPHYNVPISAVLNAYLEPCIDAYDTGNEKASSETVTDVLHDKNLTEQDHKEDAPEPVLENKLGISPSETDTENSEEETTKTSSHVNSSDEKEVPLIVEELEIEEDDNKATNHEDSTIQQHPEETYGVNEQKMTDMGENPLIIGKKTDLEASETPAPTHEITIFEQPELFYFVIFFWVLVYCLLLLPQLLSNKV
ncbi:Calmin, partial [Lamprotornis superbus]